MTNAYIQFAIASQVDSADPNDVALCRILAVVAEHWRARKAELLLCRLVAPQGDFVADGQMKLPP